MRRTLVVRFAFWAVFLAAGPTCAQQPAASATAPEQAAVAASAAPAEKIKREGLPNLGQVSDRLYRGGQPEKKGYDGLKELGVGIVVNLRDEDSRIDPERIEVESRGMRYVSLPWSGFSNPNNAQVAEFLQLLRDNPEETVFVHCRRGAERTGVMVSAFRIAEQGWTPQQALDEMEEFKFRGFWFRHLKNYVRKFPALLKSDPNLRALAPATAPQTQPTPAP